MATRSFGLRTSLGQNSITLSTISAYEVEDSIYMAIRGGAMLAVGFAALKPKGLRKLIVSNSLASMDVWRESIKELRAKLPQDVQHTLKKCEETQDFESKEYEAAIELFYKRHGSHNLWDIVASFSFFPLSFSIVPNA